MTLSTADQVLAHLRQYDLKEKNGAYRCNSPLRPGANSHSFTLKISDGEHGTWHDKVTDEGGSLYQLAERLGIETPKPERDTVENTKRTYRDLADYATQHGADVEIFEAAGWKCATYLNRPALEYPTKNGKRWRFIDGNKPYFINQDGYKACWYGLDKAIEKATATDLPLILCNGEPSVVVAQYHGFPACAKTSGEAKLPDDMLTELKSKWKGAVLLAFDCDKTGRDTAAAIEKQLEGYQVGIVDLGLTDGGDLADFCHLHGDDAWGKFWKIAPTPKMNADVDQYFDCSADAIVEVERTFTGQQEARRIARPFPFSAMHSFEGFAHIQEAGKLVYITGVSGGSKTSFAECLVEPRLKAGHDALWFGPEWNSVEMQKRAIQRNGGITFTEMSLHELWKSEERRGIPAAQRIGRPVSKQDYERTLQIIQIIKSWRGQMHQLRQHPDLNNMDKMIEAFERKCETLRKAGRTVTDFYFDYIQRAPMASRDWDKLEIAVSKIKSMCERCDLFGHILVQPTKGDSKATRDGGDLTEASAQGLSDQQANLYLTLTPEFDANGDKQPFIKVRVVKNSMGRTGMKYLKWAQRSLTIVDEEVKMGYQPKSGKEAAVKETPEPEMEV